MKKKINIVITGSWTSLNKGDAGIMISLIQFLKHSISSVNLTIVANDPDKDALRYKEKCVQAPIAVAPSLSNIKNRYVRGMIKRVIKYADPFYVLWKLFCYFTGSLFADLMSKGLFGKIFLGKGFDAFVAFYEADIILGVGGGYLSRIGKMRGFIFHAIQLAIPKWIGKPVLLCPCSIGPYDEDILGKFANKILNHVDYILLREPQSYEYMRLLGIKKDKIEVTVDGAFGLIPIQKDEALRLLHRLLPALHNFKGDLVGMTVLEWPFPELSRPNAIKRQKAYFESIVSICNYVTDQLGGVVCFLPQNVENQAKRNVPQVAKKIKSLVQSPNLIHIINKELKPEELKGLYGSMTICAVSHMHGLIYASSQCKPTLAFAYEPKFFGTLKLLKLQNLALDMYTVTPETAMEKFNYMIKNQDIIAKQLRESMVYVQSLHNKSQAIIKRFILDHAAITTKGK